MGGCATKPREDILESLPNENSNGPKQEPKAVQGDPAVVDEKVDAGENQAVENAIKEDPLVDLSDPKPDAPKFDGDVTAKSTTAITELISEIGVPNPVVSSDPVKNSDEPKKAPEVDHVEEKKAADLAPVSKTTLPVTNTAEKVHEMQKSNEEGKVASLKSEVLEKKDVVTSPVSA